MSWEQLVPIDFIYPAFCSKDTINWFTSSLSSSSNDWVQVQCISDVVRLQFIDFTTLFSMYSMEAQERNQLNVTALLKQAMTAKLGAINSTSSNSKRTREEKSSLRPRPIGRSWIGHLSENDHNRATGQEKIEFPWNEPWIPNME